MKSVLRPCFFAACWCSAFWASAIQCISHTELVSTLLFLLMTWLLQNFKLVPASFSHVFIRPYSSLMSHFAISSHEGLLLVGTSAGGLPLTNFISTSKVIFSNRLAIRDILAPVSLVQIPALFVSATILQ